MDASEREQIKALQARLRGMESLSDSDQALLNLIDHELRYEDDRGALKRRNAELDAAPVWKGKVVGTSGRRWRGK